MINYEVEKVEIIELGSNEARFLLNLNTNNRRRKNIKVAEYVSVIRDGKFKFNGASIVVSEDGVLLDGQHRLMALEELDGATIRTVLVTGVKKETMQTIDIGSKRTNADFFSLDGMKNGSALASMTRLVMEEFGNNRKSEVGERMREGEIKKGKIIISYSPEEVLRFFNNRKDLFSNALMFSENLYSTGTRLKGLTTASIGAYTILLAREDTQMSKNFLREVTKGISHNPNSNAAIFLRNKLIDITIKKQSILVTELRNLMIYCFRKYKEGADIKRLKVETQVFLKEVNQND